MPAVPLHRGGARKYLRHTSRWMTSLAKLPYGPTVPLLPLHSLL